MTTMDNERQVQMVTVTCNDCGSILGEMPADEYRQFIADNNFTHTELFGEEVVVYGESVYCCTDEFETCCECGGILSVEGREDYAYVDGEGYYCEPCRNRLLEWCEHCESYVRGVLHSVFTDASGRTQEYWCEDCYENDAVICDCCEERFHPAIILNTTVDDRDVCDECAERQYAECHTCGELVHIDDIVYGDDDTPYCPRCFSAGIANTSDENVTFVRRRPESRSNMCIIRGYHHYENDFGLPVWIERGTTNPRKDLLIGTEWEIDGGGENNDNALAITTALGYPANESNEFKCTTDGSLNNGFEIISMPATYQWHMTKYNWEAGMKRAGELGYRSHDCNTCGIHFHVSREYFYEAFENPQKALLILLANNRHWLEKFSRRTKWNYCAFKDGGNTFNAEEFKGNWTLVESKQRLLNSIMSDCGHYAAINFNGNRTIEFRFIRGTLKYTTFKAAMQLVVMLCYAARWYRFERICDINLRWFKTFAKRKGFKEFLDYLNERNITK